MSALPKASPVAILLLLGTASAAPSIPVTVTNDPAHAVPVALQGPAAVKVSGDAAASSAVQAQGTCPEPCSTNGFADVTLFTVSAGKRLVIEHVSGFVVLPAGNVALYSLQTALAGSFGGHPVDHLLGPATPAADAVTLSDPLRLYADPGTSVVFHVFSEAGSGAISYVLASFSGYLVDP